MTKPEIIFLDVDEVLAQWVTAALRVWGRDPADVFARWDQLDPRPWDVFEVVDMSANKGWRIIDEASPAYWADLEPFPWMRELYRACADVAPTYLLTSPSLSPLCYAGKVQWIRRHFGLQFADFFIGSNKQALARPGAVLIDDSPRNCAKFEAHGGRSILFPGVGNDLHAQRHDPLQGVLELLTCSNTTTVALRAGIQQAGKVGAIGDVATAVFDAWPSAIVTRLSKDTYRDGRSPLIDLTVVLDDRHSVNLGPEREADAAERIVGTLAAGPYEGS